MSRSSISNAETAGSANAKSSTDKDDPDTRAQFLTFGCAGEEYGIDILRVCEIKGWTSVTRVPHTPDYVVGVMNLRGVIVPVMDLRMRFSLERRPFDASTVVIVVLVQSAHGEKTVGIVVDGVSEVCSFTTAAIKPPPNLGGRIDDACVSGLVLGEKGMVILLDIDRLTASSIESI